MSPKPLSSDSDGDLDHLRAQRLQAHLQRVSSLAQRLGFVGPPGTAMLDFLDDRVDQLEADCQAGRLLLRAAGSLQSRPTCREDRAEAIDVHSSVRLIEEARARMAAQQFTIEVLVAQKIDPMAQQTQPSPLNPSP